VCPRNSKPSAIDGREICHRLNNFLAQSARVDVGMIMFKMDPRLVYMTQRESQIAFKREFLVLLREASRRRDSTLGETMELLTPGS
jgi:hypothetical protein